MFATMWKWCKEVRPRTIALVVLILISAVGLCLLRPDSQSLLLNVLGGALAATAFELIMLLVEKGVERWSRRVVMLALGEDAIRGGVTLAVSTYKMKESVRQSLNDSYPYVPVDPTDGIALDVQEPVAAHDLVAVAAVAASLGKNGVKCRIARVVEVANKFDMSFIAFGLGGSVKANLVLTELEQFGFANRAPNGEAFNLRFLSNGAPVAKATVEQSLGYIVRLSPKSRPGRTWILLAGFNGDGTAAAGAFFAENLCGINALKATDGRRIGADPYLIVLRSKYGYPDSARPEVVYRLGRVPQAT